jgi:cytochrome c peroxidase
LTGSLRDFCLNLGGRSPKSIHLIKTMETAMRLSGLLVAAALALLSTAPAHGQDLTDAQRAAYRRPDTIPFPADNPYTPAKAALGKMLFFDTRLSRDQNLSCASCHHPSFGWEVPFAKAIGAGGKPLGRHAPTTLNKAWSGSFFWDGRAPTLEAQAKGPIEAPPEMDLPLAHAVQRLAEVKGYQTAFAQAFPKQGLTDETLLKAIATYERTVVTGDTPFDRWVRGDAAAMPESARRGFQLFAGKARCALCHSGWNFSDDKFHDIGLPSPDLGRAVVTHQPADEHAFKTPSLREIAARAPYMHSGEVPTLEAVMAHYIGGGQARASLSPLMKPLPLNGRELEDLLAFMRSLSSPQAQLVMPHLPAQ